MAPRSGAKRQDQDDAATLDRALSKLGRASRKLAREFVLAGRVTVNGRVVRNPGTWVRLGADVLALDGAIVESAGRTYLALNKPRGLVTTREDEKGRGTVYGCLGEHAAWVFPVGRLDKDSSGLLLLTNDTAFGDLVTSPASHVPKSYAVKVRGVVADADLERLREGIAIGEGGRTLPARVERRRSTPKGAWFDVELVEGRNRQIRRMFEAVGARVEQLVRTRIGDLELGDLASGAWRHLSAAEVEGLRKRASPGRTRRVSGRGDPPGRAASRRR